MNKGAPLIEFGIHDEGHEVILVKHGFKQLLYLLVLWIVLRRGVLLLSCVELHQRTIVTFVSGSCIRSHLLVLLVVFIIDLLLVQERFEGLEKTQVTVGHREVGNGCSVVDVLQEVLVVLDGFLGYLLVHCDLREAVDLLYDGVLLLLIFSRGLLASAICSSLLLS